MSEQNALAQQAEVRAQSEVIGARESWSRGMHAPPNSVEGNQRGPSGVLAMRLHCPVAPHDMLCRHHKSSL